MALGQAVDLGRVDYGTLGSFDMDPSTVICWFNLDSHDHGAVLWSKPDSSSPFGRVEIRFENPGTFDLTWTATTTALNYDAPNNSLSTGIDYFLATVIDTSIGSGGSVRCWLGTLTSISEISWNTTQEGSGLYGVTGNNFSFLNRIGTDGVVGYGSAIAVYPVALTEAQVLARWRSWAPWSANSPELYSIVGLDGATAPDYSGNGRDGTVVSLSAGPHVPLPHPFWVPGRVTVAVAAVGGLGIPIAAYHYNHHLGSMQ